VSLALTLNSYSQDLSIRLHAIQNIEQQFSNYLDSLKFGSAEEFTYLSVLEKRIDNSTEIETQRILDSGKKCSAVTEKMKRLSGEKINIEYDFFSGGDDAFYKYLISAEGNPKIVHKNNKFSNYAFSVNFIIDDFGLPRIVSFEKETDNTCDECKEYLKTLFANAPKWTPKKINGVKVYSETKTLRIYFLR
jgi:hypothetical protein